VACLSGEVIGGGEHLKGTGYIEQLDIREGQELDPARRWRNLWVIWHFRQTVPCQVVGVQNDGETG
jgi:hypothetical protein